MKLYKEREIESIFLEIIEPNKKKNKIIRCIYKHPNVPVTADFVDSIYESLLYPTINTLTRIIATSKTLIENINFTLISLKEIWLET